MIYRTVLAIYRKLGEAYIIKKGDYRRAMELYEWCANNYPHSGGELSRGYSIAPYYLKAGLCHFAINVSPHFLSLLLRSQLRQNTR